MLMIYLSMFDTADERQKMSDIYEQNKYILLHYALKLTHNQQMAEDAVHNTFLAIIKHKEKYFALDHRNLRAAIVIILKNKCLDMLKANKAHFDIPIDDVEYELASDETPIDEQFIKASDYDNLIKSLETLDEVSQQVLNMKYILNMSYAEIANELGFTTKRVDNILIKAKAKLRKMIASEMSFYE